MLDTQQLESAIWSISEGRGSDDELAILRADERKSLTLLDRLHLHGTARHELHASWRGRDVVVFATDDAHRFGKVYRSLRRAVERRDAARRRGDTPAGS